METIEDYLERMKSLAQRNEDLSKHLKELVGKYEEFSAQSEQYNQLLQKYGFENLFITPPVTPQKTKRFKMASLLYITVSGFDKLYNSPNSQALMDHLDALSILVEDVASRYNLLRIKTVGDSFLFAGGILSENRTNPIDVVLAALEIRSVWREESALSGDFWTIGMGIHTGPVFGESTGKRHTPFYLSGDSVNIVTRLGMSAPANAVRLSVMTYELVKEFFQVARCGMFPVKYNGMMDVFLLEDILPCFLDTSRSGINHQFYIKYSIIQFMDLQELVLDLMEERLPRNLYYHNIKHTIDVITEVELIGWAEGLSDEEVLLLKVAALFHDAGHTVDYQNHEYHSVLLAEEILPQFNYSEEQIATVKRLILATRFPHNPQDLMEKVMCDSDLDYLGRSDFIPVSNNLYLELKERSLIGSWNEWNNLQLEFINRHHYFTNTAQKLRQVNKQLQIERIRSLIEA